MLIYKTGKNYARTLANFLYREVGQTKSHLYKIYGWVQVKNLEHIRLKLQAIAVRLSGKSLDNQFIGNEFLVADI